VDNLNWIYPTLDSPHKASIALPASQQFFADGSSLCELPTRCLTVGVHSKVDIFPFYLMPVIQN